MVLHRVDALVTDHQNGTDPESCSRRCKSAFEGEARPTNRKQVNGSLGSFVLEALVKAGFDVLVLTTNSEKSATLLQETGVQKSVQVQYVKDQLVSILRGQDAVVSLISRLHSEPQNVLADATAEAGVPRLIPSYWGVDTKIPELRSNPALESKVEVEDHVDKLVAAGKLTFTGINGGMFLDWALERGIFLTLNGPTMLLNGGDVRISTSSREDLARALVAVLQNPEQFENKLVNIHSIILTQNKLIRLAREVAPDHEFKIVPFDTKIAWDKSQAAYDRGERSADAMRGFILHGLYGSGLGEHQADNSASVGIEPWSDEKLKELIASIIKGPKKDSLALAPE